MISGIEDNDICALRVSGCCGDALSCTSWISSGMLPSVIYILGILHFVVGQVFKAATFLREVIYDAT